MAARKQTAETFLTSLVASADTQADSPYRLPPIVELARRAGVAYVTMWKAVQRLRDSGRIRVVPGGGIFAVPPSDSSSRAALPSGGGEQGRSKRRDEVRGEIIHRIVHGRFGAETVLPGAAELRQLFGCTHHTIAGALQALRAEGWVERYGRGYRVCAATSTRPWNTLVVICHITYMHLIVDATPFASVFWRSLLTESIRRNLTLDIRGYHNPPGGKRERLYENPPGGAPLGYVVYAPSLPREELADIIANLGRSNAPAVVFDEASNPWLAHGKALPPTVAAVSLRGSYGSGFDMGRHLVAKGHRRGVCLMPVAEIAFAARRAEGLRAAFGQGGPDCEVEVLAAFDRQADFDAFVRSDPKLNRLRRQLVAFEREFVPTQKESAFLYGKMLTVWRVKSQLLKHALSKQLQRALKNRAATVWVGVNDEAAQVAGEYLHYGKKPVHVPIYGFDNRIETLGRVHGTYDFRVEAALHAALESVLNRDRLRGHLGQYHEVPGVVVDRPLHELRVR